MQTIITIVVLFLTSVFLLGCCSFSLKGHKGPESDHFDGKTFHNQVRMDKGFSDFLKWQLTADRQPWPERYIPIKTFPPPEKRLREGLKATWVNQSTFLIQWNNLNILTDPVWSDVVGPNNWVGPKRYHKPGVNFEDVPEIDVIIISHNHYDHMDIPTLKKLTQKSRPLVLVGLGNKEFLESEGITNVFELDWWGEYNYNSEFSFTFLPVQHFSGRGLCDRNNTLWGAFALSFKSQNIFFGGDFGYGPEIKQIAEKFKTFELALIPVGAYEPRWFMKYAHINPEEAVTVHQELNSKLSIPMHFGTFRQTDEGRDEPIKKLQQALSEKKIDLTLFQPLEPGESKKIN